MRRKIIYTGLILLGIPLIIAVSFILYLQFTEYNPAALEFVASNGKGQPLPSNKSDFSFLTWNIGYAGMGKELDFFYDGGKTVQPEKPDVEKYMKGITSEIRALDSVDFLLIQEIDKDSKRTYGQDQLSEIEKALPAFCSAYAANYKVGFIPVPPMEPMGKVTAGLSTFSRFPSENNERHAYDAFFSWPKRLMFLKRCFLVSTFTVLGGKQLIVVNLHNSAFDIKGELRNRELAILQTYLQREYQKGSFIIVGGDWNSNPRGFRQEEIRSGDKVYSMQPEVGDTFMPGWQVVYDHFLPSNRNADIPYQKGVTGTTIIDFFVISPNVKALNCFTLDKGFENSDHNPVFAKFRLDAGFSGNIMF